jgi:hypothetical protein
MNLPFTHTTFANLLLHAEQEGSNDSNDNASDHAVELGP